MKPVLITCCVVILTACAPRDQASAKQLQQQCHDAGGTFYALLNDDGSINTSRCIVATRRKD